MNYRTSYKVLIQCKRCNCRQEATISKDIESNIQFYNQVCLGCGEMIMTEEDVVDIPYDIAEEISDILKQRAEHEIKKWCFQKVYYDLWGQSVKLTKFPNQKKAIMISQRRVLLRKEKSEGEIVFLSKRLLELNFKSF